MQGLPATFEQMIESKFLKKEDVTPDKLFTIRAFEYTNAAGEGQPAEMKYAMYFNEHAKPMLLNSTNIQLLKMALGVNGPQEAIGRQIVAFNDPTVSYGGKLVGGIRLRAPRVRQAPAPVSSFQHHPPVNQASTYVNPAHVDKFDDEVPF
jgi:hypothetical protein